MAIPRRIDGALHGARTLGRRPLVLARLPHVGERVPSPEPITESREKKADLPLQHELQGKRSRSDRSGEQTSKRRQSLSSKTKTLSKTRASSKTSSHTSQPTGLAAGLFQIHSHMAPYAGAVVALALVASAGLLYWMIVSPDRVPFEAPPIGSQSFGSQSFEGSESFETSAVGLPEFVPQPKATSVEETAADDLPWWDSEDSPDFSQQVAPLAVPHQEESQPMPLTEQRQALSVEEPALELPTEDVTVNIPEQPAALPSGPIFPTTERPTALDFAKIGVSAKQL